VSVVHKAPGHDPESIHALVLEANASERCVGLIVWMHTFSSREDVDRRSPRAAEAAPPPPHAFNRELSWAEVDMDFRT
jgi:L-arabinose isomerase